MMRASEEEWLAEHYVPQWSRRGPKEQYDLQMHWRDFRGLGAPPRYFVDAYVYIIELVLCHQLYQYLLDLHDSKCTKKLLKRATKCILNHKNPISIDEDGDAKSIY